MRTRSLALVALLLGALAVVGMAAAAPAADSTATTGVDAISADGSTVDTGTTLSGDSVADTEANPSVDSVAATEANPSGASVGTTEDSPVVTGEIASTPTTATAGDLTQVADADIVDECAAEPPEDFADPDAENDEVIGWFDGYWYNEPLDIDTEDGITQEELEALSARTAARFEAMRCLAFSELPPVEIITREEFEEETGQFYETIGEEEALFDNAQLETLLLVGAEEDSLEVREANRAATVGGYYNFQEEFIVIISDDPDSLLIDEEILAHELGHAIQDQHFDLAGYERATNDQDKGKLGVIEGDVHLIEHHYLRHCEADRWEEPCVTEPDVDDSAEDGATEPANWGLYFMEFQPYSDGPNFVEYIYEEAGEDWDAVDALYDDMPQTALHVIYPEKYGEVEPVTDDLVVEDDSGGDWERLTVEDGPDHQVIGQGGMTAILMAPPYETADQAEPESIIDPLDFLNVVDPATGAVDQQNPLDYAQPETDGWRGDRLYAYTDGNDRVGTVWKVAFTDEENVLRFVDAYEQKIEYRGGERVDGYAHVHDFGDDGEFRHAVALEPDGDRLWIVTAPTVDELTDVHGDVELLDEDERASVPDDDTDDVDDDDADDGDDEADDGDDPIPGFGPLTAVFVLGTLLASLGLSRVLR